jgi:alkaline phosphatase D
VAEWLNGSREHVESTGIIRWTNLELGKVGLIRVGKTLVTVISSLLFVFQWVLGASALTAETEYRVAFGSCLKQDEAMPVWSEIESRAPDMFIFGGDNVYADIGAYKLMRSPKNFEKAYQNLASNPQFVSFQSALEARSSVVMATWDDHDYGLNDGGEENEHKLAAKKAFMDFFNPTGLAVDSANEAGVYSSSMQVVGDLNLQVIVLDTRSFRSAFEKRKNKTLCSRGGWEFRSDPDATVLGQKQWTWFEQQLEQSADLRLIVSSIQVLPTEQCFEKWANFPAEREKLLTLIAEKTGGGVILLSGDRHLSEISVLERDDIGYPLYEVTSSGLNNALKGRFDVAEEPNSLRALPDNVSENGFGEIAIVPHSKSDTLVEMRLFNEEGTLLQSLSVPLRGLRKVVAGE